jgi:hypothetical protein
MAAVRKFSVAFCLMVTGVLNLVQRLEAGGA